MSSPFGFRTLSGRRRRTENVNGETHSSLCWCIMGINGPLLSKPKKMGRNQISATLRKPRGCCISSRARPASAHVVAHARQMAKGCVYSIHPPRTAALSRSAEWHLICAAADTETLFPRLLRFGPLCMSAHACSGIFTTVHVRARAPRRGAVKLPAVFCHTD